MNLPPEVYGCLTVAQAYLDRSRKWKERKKKGKHLMKVQRAISKAIRYLHRRQEMVP
jgi:hypothetical protein